jgi:hypothetical protein
LVLLDVRGVAEALRHSLSNDEMSTDLRHVSLLLGTFRRTSI